MNQVKVRGSEVQSFLRCRKKWNWEWVEGYRPNIPNNKLFFGTLFHKYLEVLYDTKQPKDAYDVTLQLFQDTDVSGMEQPEVASIWNLFEIVSQQYLEKWWENDETWEILATEYHFEIELDGTVVFEGTIDLIFKDEKGRIWFADHKTTNSIDKYEKNAVMDRQISRYWWALTKLGMEPYGFIYNIILKDYPEKPKLLKTGKLSTAKTQKTTLDLYLQAIEDCGLDVDNYQEYLQFLKENPREYFKRVVVKRTPMEAATAMHEFYWTVKDTVKLRNEPSDYLYRNITSDCSWECSFYQVCQLDIQGQSIDSLLNTVFTKEENK